MILKINRTYNMTIIFSERFIFYSSIKKI